MTEGDETGVSASAVDENAVDAAARRRRARRFGAWLAVFVVLLMLFAVGYVTLFGKVLSDPTRPPTVTSAANPRVTRFELVLGAAIVVGVTTWLARRARSKT